MAEHPEYDEIRLGIIADCIIDDNLKPKLYIPDKTKWLTVSRKLLHQIHIHLRGKSRAGKTARFLTPYAQQLLLFYGRNFERKDCVFFFDLGGTKGLFRAAESEAKAKGRRFRFLSMGLDDDWCTFDPFQSIAEQCRSVIVLVEFLLTALNLEFGPVYGASWYTQANMAALLSAAKEMEKTGDSSSLKALVEHIERANKKDGDQIRMMLSVLLEFPQMQHVEGREKLDFRKALEDGEVIYFYLPSVIGSTSTREIAGLGLYAAVVASMEREEKAKEKRHAHLIIDEVQGAVGKGFADLLSQASKYSISIVACHQTTEQMKLKNLDLNSIIGDNTSIKLFYTVTEDEDFEYLQRLSNDEITKLGSQSIKQGSVFDTESTRDVVQPILHANIIREVSRTEGYCFCVVDDGKGHKEPYILYCPYGLSEDIHNERYELPKRNPGELLTVKPVVGINKPYVPSWKRDHSNNPVWIDRQEKLLALWQSEGGAL